MREMTALEDRIVEIAQGLGFLAELCNFIDYDPDVGAVKGHFRPRPEVLRLVEGLQLLEEPAATRAEAAAPADASAIKWPPQPEAQRFIVEIEARRLIHRNEVLDALHRSHLALRTDISVSPISEAATITVHEPATAERRPSPAAIPARADRPMPSVTPGGDEAHMIYFLLKKGYRITNADGSAPSDLRERLLHLMLSYGSQCVEADRALREVRDGKENAQREVDYHNGRAERAVELLLSYFPEPSPVAGERA